jgi:two-component system response regulator YesN
MKPLKVLIVDDEVLVIEDIINLLQCENIGLEIIGQATSGKKALDLFLKHHPQIVITDIRMPVMDGLELSKKLLEMDPTVKIILLTAYKDFEYAKQAISLGVAEYLLKHDINETSLNRMILKLKAELQNQESTQRILNREQLRQLFEGELQLNSSEVSSNLQRLLRGCYGLLLIQIDEPFMFIQNEQNESRLHQLNFSIIEDLKEYDKFSYAEVVKINYKQGLIIVSMNEICSYKTIGETLYQLALKIADVYQKKCKSTLSIVIAYSGTGGHVPSAVFTDMQTCLEHSIFIGKSKIVWLPDVIHLFSSKEADFKIDTNQLLAILRKGDEAALKVFMNQLFDSVKNPVWNAKGLKKLCEQLIYVFNLYSVENRCLNFKQIFEKERMEDVQCYTFEMVRDIFIKIYRNAMCGAKKSKSLQYSKKIQQALQFIQTHYNEDITVDTVASFLNISGVYLSQLFKKELGQTFLEYLTAFRIDISKSLLESGKYKIYEISEMVGYKTSQYFSKVFKRITGVNPYDYKENSGGEK